MLMPSLPPESCTKTTIFPPGMPRGAAEKLTCVPRSLKMPPPRPITPPAKHAAMPFKKSRRLQLIKPRNVEGGMWNAEFMNSDGQGSFECLAHSHWHDRMRVIYELFSNDVYVLFQRGRGVA